jgi:phosphatidylethanolamine N-methyltransferase
MWVPIHDDEWDGNVPLGLDRPPTPGKDSKGEVIFKGSALPWLVGRYEVEDVAYMFNRELNFFRQVRYHHDGKHNVLSLDGPLEVYGMLIFIRDHSC